MQDYLHKLLEGAKPIWAAVLASLNYVLFPDKAYFTAVIAVGMVIVLDIITKMWALSRLNGGYGHATRTRKIWSKTLWEGTKVKLYAYTVVFILAGLSYRVSPLAQASVFLATVVYSVIFLRESQSVLENLMEAGADLGWLLVFVKRKQADILEQQIPTPVQNRPLDLEPMENNRR